MDDKLTISLTGTQPGKPVATGDDATAFHLARGEADPGWTPLTGHTGGGPGQRYLLGRELGRGGMGVVSEGWDTHLQRSVAIKIMDRAQHARPGGLQRFFREARIASRLEHPGIVTIHEFDVAADDEAFIVMQLLSGHILKRVLTDTTDRAAALPALLAVFHDVCQAMASAHGAGVIHRDLKPSNIMVGPFGVVTVMDWGVAKVIDGDDEIIDDVDVTVPVIPATEETSQSHSTIAGTVFGTPSYLAPRAGPRRCGRPRPPGRCVWARQHSLRNPHRHRDLRRSRCRRPLEARGGGRHGRGAGAARCLWRTDARRDAREVVPGRRSGRPADRCSGGR